MILSRVNATAWMFSRILISGLTALICCNAANAGATELDLCYNYACRERVVIKLSEAHRSRLRPLFLAVHSAADERVALAHAVGQLYAIAATQSPIWRDRGGNAGDDEAEDGRMDCIDHATNTTTFLQWLAAEGWARHHRVEAPVARGWVFNQHRAASVAAIAPIEANGIAHRYAIDSWFFDPGTPAVIFNLDAWQRGARPPGTAVWSSGWSGTLSGSNSGER